MSDKMVILCNNAQTGIMPTLIMGSSGITLDNETILFFCPGGATALLKGELEKLGTPKGLPNPVELFNTILDHGGQGDPVRARPGEQGHRGGGPAR